MRRRQVLAAGVLAISAGAAGCNDTSLPPPDEQFDRPDDRWPTPGYDPANTARPPAGPRDAAESWATTRAIRTLRSGRLSAPVVSGGTVYVATLAREFFDPEVDSSHLNAFDAGTGDRAWKAEFPRGLTGCPALAGSAVVVGGRDGTLHAVRGGETVWSADLGTAVGTPTVYGDRIYVPDGTGRLYALAGDGDRLWTAERPGVLEKLFGEDEPLAAGVPAADGSGVYAAFEAFDDDRDALLLAYDHDGNRRWRRELEAPDARVPAGPTVADGVVYATAGGTVHAVDAETGDRRWRFVTGYGTAGPPSTDGDRVYVAAKNLYALDAAAGTEQWRVVNDSVAGRVRPDEARSLPYLARCPVAEGSVYLRAGAVDADTGRRLWGDDADDWLTGSDRRVRPYVEGRPMSRPAVTAGALYLSHAHRGVVKVA